MVSEPILIGITGNIGSGKSVFCKLLEENNYKVVYTDDIAQQQLNDPDSQKQLVKRWGKEIIVKGKADRKKIAAIVFSDKNELDFLNSVIHPKTLSILQHIAENSADKVIFFEVPLLFEAGMQHCFDYIILIYADWGTKIKRLMRTGKTSEAEIRDRLDAQIDDVVKIPLCDLVIDNNGSLGNLKERLTVFLTKLDTIRQKEKIPFST